MKKSEINVHIITHSDIINSGCFNMMNAINVVNKTLKKYSVGDILNPDKVSQVFSEETQRRINCLPATIRSDSICGMKWVSVFPDNPILHGVENLSAVLLLSNLKTGYPFAFMEGTLCSALRTAAISATACKQLASEKSTVLGIIGAGEQAKMHFIGMKTVCPTISVCKVASRRSISVDSFIQTFEGVYPDVKFISCNSDYERAAEDADILVTAISGQSPIVKNKWLKKGVFYCHVGGWEDEYEVALNMDKIVTDDWESVKHRTQTISRMYKEGLLTDEDIYSDLYEIVIGNKLGRVSDDENIYFNTVGLSYIDVALAYDFYKKVLKAGYGRTINLRAENIFENLKQNMHD